MSAERPGGIPELDVLLHDGDMRALYCLGDIDRETLWQLERQWANGLGKPLPPEAFEEATQLAASEGYRFWTYIEEQELPVAELILLAKERREALNHMLGIQIDFPQSLLEIAERSF